MLAKSSVSHIFKCNTFLINGKELLRSGSDTFCGLRILREVFHEFPRSLPLTQTLSLFLRYLRQQEVLLHQQADTIKQI